MLPTIRQVKLIGRKKFAIITFDLDYKAFIIYIIAINISFNLDVKVHLSKNAKIAYLNLNKILIDVFDNFANFANIFFKVWYEVFKVYKYQ